MTTLPGDACRCHHLRFNHAGDGSGEGGRCLMRGCTCAEFSDITHDTRPDQIDGPPGEDA